MPLPGSRPTAGHGKAADPAMKFTPLPLAGALVIEPKVFPDDRGAFWEFYKHHLFSENGILESFVQDNQNLSGKGVLRGLHWQTPPMEQSKLVRAVAGSVYDVIVDIRKESKTYGRWHAETLSAANRKILYVPVGFAHGFLSLEEGSEVHYKVSNRYSPVHERGLVWNDSRLGIRWPETGVSIRVSSRDQAFPTLDKTTF